ncbi:MAG: SCO family protein, partial [Pseudomonadota bacterium]
ASFLSQTKDPVDAMGGSIAQSQTYASVLSAPRPLPELALVDQTGEPFGRTQLAGRWSLLFFGFTHCPDVCPTTLSDMRRLRKSLQDLPGTEQPNIVFVSVDPERDTPETIASYLAFFDAAATGLTGTLEAIEDLTGELGVAVAYLPDEEGTGYTVDHTAALFAVNPNAELAAIFVPPHNLEHMASDWRTIIAGAAR